ncbi:hypothetical protein N9U89_00530 [Candidatus Pelagibacter sp.]|nr:hypothetical protein [Candidatus Pelagibacter sp.]
MRLIFKILIFLLINLKVFADIKQYEVEGMSIGDSALKFYSEEEILKNQRNFFRQKSVKASEFLEVDGIYDDIQLMYKSKDKTYSIIGISGIIMMNIDKCKNILDNEAIKISSSFGSDLKKDYGKRKIKHSYDKSGKSFVIERKYKFSNNDQLIIACYYWSDKIKNKDGYNDNFRVSLRSKYYSNFLKRE